MSPLDTHRQWFWASEVAKLCHVSRQTIYAWIECGKIQTLLTIRPYKIPRREVERIVNQNFVSF